MQLPAAVGALSGTEIVTGMALTVAVYAALLVTRFGFINVSIVLIRALDRRPQQRLLRTTWRGRVVSTVAGFRGAVSLAVALAVPATLADGSAFPARDLIVFVTAGVVTTSLVLQGLLLGPVIRWARLPQDRSEERELDLATRTMSREVVEALPRLAADVAAGPRRLRTRSARVCGAFRSVGHRPVRGRRGG